jgi:hypothetical protein
MSFNFDDWDIFSASVTKKEDNAEPAIVINFGSEDVSREEQVTGEPAVIGSIATEEQTVVVCENNNEIKEEIVEANEEVCSVDESEYQNENVVIVEETKNDIAEEEKPVEDTAVEEPVKKRKRRTKAEMEAARTEEAVQEKEPVKEETEDTEEKKEPVKKETKKESAKKEVDFKQQDIKINLDKVDLDKFKTKFFMTPIDPNWDETVKWIESAMEKLRFEDDINIGSIKIIIPQIANTYAEIEKMKAEYDAIFETLNDITTRQYAKNSVGNNDADRKRNGHNSVEDIYGMNAYDYIIVFRSRQKYLDAQLRALKFKKDCMIGALSLLKLEAK